MNRVVVLLDSHSARLFHLGAGAPESLRMGHPDHHTHRADKGDNASHAFYEQVANHLKDATEVFVLGHGLAKTHFKTHLESHHPSLAAKVIGYETVDNPTDGQVVALAKLHFKPDAAAASPAP
jgi:stalled ribosome rescue protein Dom34